jgi:hypothetical protein
MPFNESAMKISFQKLFKGGIVFKSPAQDGGEACSVDASHSQPLHPYPNTR